METNTPAPASEPDLLKQLAAAVEHLGLPAKLGASAEELVTRAAIEANARLAQPLIEQQLSEVDAIKDNKVTDQRVVACGDFSNFDNFVCAYALHLVHGDNLILEPYKGIKQKLLDADGNPVTASVLYQIGNVGSYDPARFATVISVANQTGPDIGSLMYSAMRAETITKTDDDEDPAFSRRIINAVPYQFAVFTRPMQLLQQALFFMQSQTWATTTIPGTLPTPVTTGGHEDIRKLQFRKLMYTLDSLYLPDNEPTKDAKALIRIVGKLELTFEAWDYFFLNFKEFGLK